MPAHIVAHTPPSWGHMKPLLVFLARLAERRPASSLTFSILTGPPLLPKVQRDLALMPSEIAERIHVVDIGPPKGMMGPALGFIPAFEALWKGAAVAVASGSSQRQAILPRPTAILLDVMCGFALPVIKDVSASACPVIAWYSAPVSHGLDVLGPEHLGGHGNLAAKIEDTAKKEGKAPAEVADSVYKSFEGRVIRIPGLPPMYDYDMFPQEDHFDFPAAMIIQHWHKTLIVCNALVAATSSAFEAGSVVACREWLNGLGIPTFIVGPLEDVPPQTVKENQVEVPKPSEDDLRVIKFLDDMQAKHGKQSVIYLAFGTFWTPKDPTKLHAIIDEIINCGSPIIWGHASPFAKVPEELAAKIEAHPDAYHANWMPQREILSHPAMGWFITHGGWNGIQEALSLRVPMIMWPFGGDQPSNAALMTITHQAAFELVSVRIGEGARQPYYLADQAPVDFSIEGVRREVRDLLEKLRGSEGAQVRTNAEALAVEMEKGWKRGGEADTQADKLLRVYFD